MENPARYERKIYSVYDNSIYVNLFIASELHSEKENIKLIQDTAFPESDKTTFVFQQIDSQELTVHIR
ncbi:beta-L-arabinofuranosidase domain-containing protein, partial [Pseudomonas sp. 2995-1]|uniref:beta-L-arabinofuranosidase domain-containing protein n=1 Tax=Pseudomonas sp. 2995-1 TaxID=1712679 RepID=UPI002115B12A